MNKEYGINMTVQQYISGKESPDKEVLTILRSWVLDLGAHTQEKISYTVPFFYFFGPLCYLSAGKEGVAFSFVNGRELEDEAKLLQSNGRKQVKSVTFHSVAELEEHEDEIRRLLNQAAILNEYKYKIKKRKKR